MATYRGLSPQATAVRGGISARTAGRRSNPISPRTIAPAYDASQAIEAPVDMVEQSPGVFDPAPDAPAVVDGPTYSPSSDLRGFLDDYSTGTVEDMARQRVGSGLTSAAMAGYMGADPTQIAEVGTRGLLGGITTPAEMMLSGLLDSFAKEKLGNTYGDILGDTTRKELDTYAEDAALDLADPTETYSGPEEIGKFEATKAMLGQYDQMTRSPLSQFTSGLAESVNLKDKTLNILDDPTVPEKVKQLLGDSYGNGAGGFKVGRETTSIDDSDRIKAAFENTYGPFNTAAYNRAIDEGFFEGFVPEEKRSLVDSMLSQDPTNAEAMLHSPSAQEYSARKARNLEPLFGGPTDMRGREGGEGGGRSGNSTGSSAPGGEGRGRGSSAAEGFSVY